MGMRGSVASLDTVNVAPAVEMAASSPSQFKTPRHHRFSMLKFRHASDSQLAKTAREHERSNAPPIPSSMSSLSIAGMKMLMLTDSSDTINRDYSSHI